MITCEICKKQFKNNSGLGRHISLTHNMSSKEYYDMYMKKENEGKCKICNEETSFRNWSVGYLEYCSTKCVNLDEDIKKKSKETYFKKHGYNKEKTEKEIMFDSGFYRIYDSGSFKYIYTI